MSSVQVRTLIREFLAANSSEVVVDLTGHFEDLRELLSVSGVGPDSPWLGLDFSTDGEEPVSLTADNAKGLYREYGIILLHVCAVAKLGVGRDLETRGEVLLNLFRGRRIGSCVIERVSPINTGPGATLEFDAGYVSGSLTATYHSDKALGGA